MTKKEFEAVRLVRVRQLFEARPAEDRTETGVLLFARGYKSTTLSCCLPDQAMRIST